MFVVPLLNSSICYFNFLLILCFFCCLEWKHILHRYGNSNTAVFKYMNSSNLTHFSLSPKICSHWSSKQCQFGFSGVMSVPVSSMSHFHPSATPSPADGHWHSSDLFLNYISVEFIWFIWSMLHNQQPCTPTHQSNLLTTQATAGASSLLMLATPTDPGTSCSLSVRQRGLSCALSVLLVPMLTVAASTRLTWSSSTIAATSLPASTATTLPTAGDAITDGISTGKIANPTSEANMPTVCRIITTAQCSNLSDGAVSSDSSIADILPLVSMNSLIEWIRWLNEFIWLSKWIHWLHEFIYTVPLSYEFTKQMNSSIFSLWIHQTFEFIYIVHFAMWIHLIIICC